jgi:hypothetical protein
MPFDAESNCLGVFSYCPHASRAQDVIAHVANVLIFWELMPIHNPWAVPRRMEADHLRQRSTIGLIGVANLHRGAVTIEAPHFIPLAFISNARAERANKSLAHAVLVCLK